MASETGEPCDEDDTDGDDNSTDEADEADDDDASLRRHDGMLVDFE